VAALTMSHVQQRDGRWVHCGLGWETWARQDDPDAHVGEGGDRCVDFGVKHCGWPRVPSGAPGDRVRGKGLSEKVVWQLLQGYAETVGAKGIAPNDLRRTCAKLCRTAGGELEQIQLLLGHASVQTTERYLGTKQDLVHAPNDGIKLRVAV
jgi:hypothetical protein